MFRALIPKDSAEARCFQTPFHEEHENHQNHEYQEYHENHEEGVFTFTFYWINIL